MKDSPRKDLQRKTLIIKRYQNRKLYDTLNSVYVTLEDIGRLIRQGEDVKVIDNKSKEDLTSVTLTQIIFEEEKKSRHLLPLVALKKIIRGGGDAILELVNKTTDNVHNTISHVKEGAETIYEKIRDELNPDDNLLGKIKSTVGSIAHVTSLQGEIHNLRERIHYLEKKLKVYEHK